MIAGEFLVTGYESVEVGNDRFRVLARPDLFLRLISFGGTGECHVERDVLRIPLERLVLLVRNERITSPKFRPIPEDFFPSSDRERPLDLRDGPFELGPDLRKTLSGRGLDHDEFRRGGRGLSLGLARGGYDAFSGLFCTPRFVRMSQCDVRHDGARDGGVREKIVEVRVGKEGSRPVRIVPEFDGSEPHAVHITLHVPLSGDEALSSFPR